MAMKIYHCVESYYPSVGGMQEVVRQLSERLVKLGHDVTVLTRHHPLRNSNSFNGVKIVHFNIEGNPKKVTNKNEQAYVDFLLDLEADIITFFAAQQWATDLALPLLPKIKAKKVSVPTGYSGLYWPEFAGYFEDMKKYIHDYDMNVYLSDDYRDINFARENRVKNMVIIPNGAAEDEFLPASAVDIRADLKIPGSHFLILLVGSYTGWKGHREAIEVFLRSSVGDSTLLMIGNNFEAYPWKWLQKPMLYLRYLSGKIKGNKKIIFTFLPREKTVAAYKAADLFLFPSNIECSPIVLFECAAAALPFLASDAGNSIEISKWTRGGEIIPTSKDTGGFSHIEISEGVKKLEALYADAARRNKMGEESFKIWREKFSWEVITKMYEQMYQQQLGK